MFAYGGRVGIVFPLTKLHFQEFSSSRPHWSSCPREFFLQAEEMADQKEGKTGSGEKMT